MKPGDLQRFKRQYGSRADAALARTFKISVRRVRELAEEHCLGKDKAHFHDQVMPRWSAEQVTVLQDLYATTDNETIARRVRKTVKAVMAKAHRLGLHKDTTRLVEMGRTNVAQRTDR